LSLGVIKKSALLRDENWISTRKLLSSFKKANVGEQNRKNRGWLRVCSTSRRGRHVISREVGES